MGHYHSYEAEAKGLGTSVLDFTEEEWKVNIKRPAQPQNNAGNISFRGNIDDTAKRHLNDYSLAYSEAYNKKDTNVNQTVNSIRANLHDQKPEEAHLPARKVKHEARDVNHAIQFAEDIHYLRFEANNTVNVNNNPMIVFNIPPIDEQLYIERQRGQASSDRFSRFLEDFEMTLDIFEQGQKKIKLHEISDNPKFKGDLYLLHSRHPEEKSFHASKNKNDSRLLEMSQRDNHHLNASMYSDKRTNQSQSQMQHSSPYSRDQTKHHTETSQKDHHLNASMYSDKKTNSYDKPLNQSQNQMQNSNPYYRDETKYHTFKADNNSYDMYMNMHSSQRNEESQLSNQKYSNEANESQKNPPQNPFYDHHNTSYSYQSPEKTQERQITPRSSANKKVQVGESLSQSNSRSQIRQSQTKTPPTTNQKVLNQSKKLESSGHKSSKAVATTPQKHIPIVPSTSQNKQFQTPDSRTKTPPPRRTSPSPNTLQKTDQRSVSPYQKDSRIKYKAFWREAVRPTVVKNDGKRVPLKHESEKIKEGFDFLKAMKPIKVNPNDKPVSIEKKKPAEQLFDRSHDYELILVRPSVQKSDSIEANNEQPQSQRDSRKKMEADKKGDEKQGSKIKKILKDIEADGDIQDSKTKKSQKKDHYANEEEEYREEEEDFYDERDQDKSLAEDEYMTERYERAQRQKNGNSSNNAGYVETSIDISSYLKNQKMPKSNQQAKESGRNMYNDYTEDEENGENMYDDYDDQQQQEYYEREHELASSQNGFRDEKQQMRYAPTMRNKYNQERYGEEQNFDDHNYLHDILDRVRNLHDKMENSFSDITRDHSRIAEEDEERPEEQKYSQFKKDGTSRYKNQPEEINPFYPARQDKNKQNEKHQNFPGSSKLNVSSKKHRPQGAR